MQLMFLLSFDWFLILFDFPGNFSQPKHKTRLVLPSFFCSGHCHGNCIYLTCDVWNSKVNIRLKFLSLKTFKTVTLANYILSELFTCSIKPQSLWQRAKARKVNIRLKFLSLKTFKTVTLANYILSELFTCSIKPQSLWQRAKARKVGFLLFSVANLRFQVSCYH